MSKQFSAFYVSWRDAERRPLGLLDNDPAYVIEDAFRKILATKKTRKARKRDNIKLFAEATGETKPITST